LGVPQKRQMILTVPYDSRPKDDVLRPWRPLRHGGEVLPLPEKSLDPVLGFDYRVAQNPESM